MTQAEIDDMTETEIKVAKGIYEQNPSDWKRKYKFDYWKAKFIENEEENNVMIE